MIRWKTIRIKLIITPTLRSSFKEGNVLFLPFLTAFKPLDIATDSALIISEHLRINEGLKKIAASRIYNLKMRLLFDVNFINSLSNDG